MCEQAWPHLLAVSRMFTHAHPVDKPSSRFTLSLTPTLALRHPPGRTVPSSSSSARFGSRASQPPRRRYSSDVSPPTPRLPTRLVRSFAGRPLLRRARHSPTRPPPPPTAPGVWLQPSLVVNHTSVWGRAFAGPALFVPQLLFAGFYIKMSQIPVWLRWVQYIASLKYATHLPRHSFRSLASSCSATPPQYHPALPPSPGMR